MEAGDVVEGRYALVRVLGEGASATVWLARDRARGIDVALKALRPRHASRAWMLERFIREADVGERMLSPHIVKVLARSVAHGEIPFTVYEHLEGEDLAARLARDGPLPLADARTVIVHTCRALARAHAVGVVHRDVKPENLFLTRDADARVLVKVLDFGVAQIVFSVRESGAQAGLVGTLEYLAPEVLLGERESDARSDVYAVAAVAYECLTGKPPLVAANVGELVLAHAKGERRPARDARPEISERLEAWLDRGLAREPDARFAGAKAMADALDDALPTSRPSLVAVEERASDAPRPAYASVPYRIIRPTEE